MLKSEYIVYLCMCIILAALFYIKLMPLIKYYVIGPMLYYISKIETCQINIVSVKYLLPFLRVILLRTGCLSTGVIHKYIQKTTQV